MRKILLTLTVALSCLCAFSTALLAEKVTLPAAASIVGLAPFFSDVRVFNTSYASSLNVTATYHCFIGPCPTQAPQLPFTLAPRESRSFDDIVAGAFAAPDTAGGIEFDFAGNEDQLVVTSRLYSTTPVPTVGMFIAGGSSSKAHANAVLTSVRNGGPILGFRTNAGAYNANDASASVSLQIFNAGAAVGNPVSQVIAGHSGVQFNGIFSAAGVPALTASDAVIVATSSVPVFAYAAVLDNNTTDPIFVSGAPDQPSQPIMATTHTVHVGRGGTNFVDDVSGTGVTTANVGDTVTWVWEGDLHHGSDAGNCSNGGGGGYNPYGMHTEGYGGGDCTSNGKWGSGTHTTPFSYSYTFTESGTFPYFCDVHLGAMTGRVIVNAPAGAAGATAKRTSKPR